MTFADLVNHAKKYATDNSHVILAGIGVAGVAATAYLTGKATFEAAKVIENHNKSLAKPGLPPLDTKAKAALCWRLYIPAAGVGVLTIAAIIGSNRISANRAAGMAAAYSLSERAFKEYKGHVKTKFGENKEREVRDELAQKNVDENPPSQSFLMMGTPGRVTCLDAWTKRYFWCSMETIKKAQNDIDYKALHDGYPSLTDFYHAIGLEPTSASDQVGWTNTNRPEIMFTATLAEPFEGQGTIPVMVISHVNEPQPNYWKPSSAY